MRLLLCANNWGGWQVGKWLVERGEDICGLVVHPFGNDKFRTEIMDAVWHDGLPVFHADKLREPETVEALKWTKPEIGVSAFFGYILKRDVFEIPPLGFVNLHPSYLPHNRGWHPNVYPFIDKSPAGVSVHWIDDSIDGGDIILRERVEIEPHDTGGTLHQRLTRELVKLFKIAWPAIKSGKAPRVPNRGYGLHLRSDMRELERIDLDREYKASYLLGLLRGLTYPPYPAAYYEKGGERVYVRVELFGEDDLTPGALPEWD